MLRYKPYRIAIRILLVSCIFPCLNLTAQVILPQVGDTMFSYTMNLDQPLATISEFDFYDLDFHCMDRLAVIPPDAPRIDFEIQNQTGLGEVYAVKDGILYIKGFRMKDPYLSNSIKFTQFVGGIPLMNLDKIKDYKDKGSQNIYLEYNTEELPELLNLWAESYAYSKLRLKVTIAFSTSYQGKKALELFDFEEYHQLQTTYEFKVTEVQMKLDDWEKVALEDIPGKDQFFQDKKVSYNSYYNGITLFPNVREYSHPEFKLEYNMPYAVKNLPICTASAAQVYVYPNPTLGDVNIRIMDLEPGLYDFAVYNIIGFKVWETKLQYGEKDLFRLRLPHLDKGVYLYSIKNKQGRYIQSRRLTVLEY